jgi:hypothetical protein
VSRRSDEEGRERREGGKEGRRKEPKGDSLGDGNFFLNFFRNGSLNKSILAVIGKDMFISALCMLVNVLASIFGKSDFVFSRARARSQKEIKSTLRLITL